jgi:hypothetical protein
MRQSGNYIIPDLPDLGPVARLDDTGARPSRTGLWQTAPGHRGAEGFWVDVLA